MNKKYFILTAFLAGLLFTVITPVHGVETAPRISDREIIESLADLKAGQAAIHQRFENIDQRFNDQNKAFNERFTTCPSGRFSAHPHGQGFSRVGKD